MRRGFTVASVVFVIGVCQPTSGATWYVDASVSAPGDGTSWESDLKTIEWGIDGASDGDTVIVAEGTYVENIKFNGTDIALTSTDPLDPAVVGNTIIDGNQAGSVVTFSGTESEACILSGFTIRNGDADEGGGICGGTQAWRNRATIQNNEIRDNEASDCGGGVAYCDGVIRNTITRNEAGDSDGGALCECDGTITHNVIRGNWVWLLEDVYAPADGLTVKAVGTGRTSAKLVLDKPLRPFRCGAAALLRLLTTTNPTGAHDGEGGWIRHS